MIDSTSVLIKFNDLFEIKKYIQVAYLEYRDFGSMMDKRKGIISFEKSVSKFKTLIKS